MKTTHITFRGNMKDLQAYLRILQLVYGENAKVERINEARLHEN